MKEEERKYSAISEAEKVGIPIDLFKGMKGHSLFLTFESEN